jgi:hypothetical protein
MRTLSRVAAASSVGQVRRTQNFPLLLWVLSVTLVLLVWQGAAAGVVIALLVAALGVVLFAVARRALRCAAGQIDTILAEELGPVRESEMTSPDFLSKSPTVIVTQRRGDDLAKECDRASADSIGTDQTREISTNT